MSPNGVVMAKVASRPPSSSKVTTSEVGVAPRPSSTAKARPTSSTSKITEPTPSGWTRSQRAARPPAPTGDEQRMRTSPAWKSAERCRPACSSAGLLAATSAKSSRSR